MEVVIQLDRIRGLLLIPRYPKRYRSESDRIHYNMKLAYQARYTPYLFRYEFLLKSSFRLFTGNAKMSRRHEELCRFPASLPCWNIFCSY